MERRQRFGSVLNLPHAHSDSGKMVPSLASAWLMAITCAWARGTLRCQFRGCRLTQDKGVRDR